MKWQRFLSYFCYLFISSFLIILGCSTAPILKMPRPVPPIIKEYKHLTISGYKNLKHTEIYINKEDIYSILVTGKISNPYQDASNWTLQARIGKENPNLLPRFIYNTYTGRSHYSGYLYVGTEVGKYFQGITGSFSVDIIVWEREDYVQIVDFFDKMKEKDPTNKAINDALYEANSQKTIYLASKKASKIIEETKKKIQELEEEPEKEKEPTKLSTADAIKQEKINQLQAKLAKLMETLAQMEEMKNKELAEREKREKDLLAKLEEGSKAPPIIVIASPQDGSEVEANIIHLSGVAEDDQGLERLVIFINNKPIEKKMGRGIKVKEKRYPKRLDFEERSPLKEGKTRSRYVPLTPMAFPLRRC